MKEHPILFSGEMVKAILEGRKTQTRRVVKPQPYVSREYGISSDYDCFEWDNDAYNNSNDPIVSFCPYGQPRDRLWVRETFCPDWCDKVIYRADGGSAKAAGYAKEPKWKPSIFMPRWASRITLEITGVRVERLQDISEAAAKAEGVAAWHDTANGTVYRPEFQMLWDRINSKRGYSWASDPWVWVVGFKKVSAT